MKIVFDTNVLISAFAVHGSSHEVFEYCLTEHVIFISQTILGELKKNLLKKIKFPPALVNQIINFLQDNCEMTLSPTLSNRVCRDPDDDHILSAAATANANCIITGDQDLLVLKKHEHIAILKPADFWKFEHQSSK